jgi:hypothetical protein
MVVDMEDRLTGIGVGIDDDAETCSVHSPLTGEVGGNALDVTDKSVILRSQLKDIGDMLTGDQQQMMGGYRIDILDDDQSAILVHGVRRDLAGGYLTEQTGHNPSMVGGCTTG